MKTFKTESIREEITLFIRNWIELLSDYDPWNVTNLKEAFLDYGAVGRMPVINSPYQMDLTTEKIEFYDYDDGSGWTVDYDIPLDGEWGDLTAQFSFKKAGDSFVVKLNDIHVM
jgi:hypothetical protein